MSEENKTKPLSEYRLAKKKITVYIKRPRNQSLPNDIIQTIEERMFWSESIFNNKNIQQFIDLHKNNSSRSLKDDFISNIVNSKIGNCVTVKKYNETTKLVEELDLSAVYEYIKVKFQKKLSTIKLTSKKGTDNAINCKKKKSIIKASVDEYLPTNKKQKTNDIQSPLERLDYLPKFSDFYDHNDTPKTVDNPHWDMYSMIHNLFESFNLVVYSGSHLIDTGKQTHWMSRVVLKFPEEANFFV